MKLVEKAKTCTGDKAVRTLQKAIHAQLKYAPTTLIFSDKLPSSAARLEIFKPPPSPHLSALPPMADMLAVSACQRRRRLGRQACSKCLAPERLVVGRLAAVAHPLQVGAGQRQPRPAAGGRRHPQAEGAGEGGGACGACGRWEKGVVLSGVCVSVLVSELRARARGLRVAVRGEPGTQQGQERGAAHQHHLLSCGSCFWGVKVEGGGLGG